MNPFRSAVKLIGARFNLHPGSPAGAFTPAPPINVDLTARENDAIVFTNSYALETGPNFGLGDGMRTTARPIRWDTAYGATTGQVVSIKSRASFESLALRLLTRLPDGSNVVVTASKTDPASSLALDTGSRYGFSGARTFDDPYTTILLPPDTHFITILIDNTNGAPVRNVHLGFTFSLAARVTTAQTVTTVNTSEMTDHVIPVESGLAGTVTWHDGRRQILR